MKSFTFTRSVPLSDRSPDTVPLPSEVNKEVKADFWDAARRYKEKGLQRGSVWGLLYAEARFKVVIHANNYNPCHIYNKLKKETYAKGVGSVYEDDAMHFVQAGLLMQMQGGGFFRYVVYK